MNFASDALKFALARRQSSQTHFWKAEMRSRSTLADPNAFRGAFSAVSVLKSMKNEGYEIELPKSTNELREVVLGGNSDKYGQEANVIERINGTEIVENEPFLKEIEEVWGSAPGKIQSDGTGIFILGKKLGNIVVGIQPTFGYEGDPMRLLFEKGFAPTHLSLIHISEPTRPY